MRRDDEFVDCGDALVRVDEEPFPVERHDLYRYRLGLRGNGRARIELMGADPADPGQQDHDKRRDRPDDELDASLIGPIGAVAGAGIGRSIPPGERQRRHDHGNDDNQHDFGGVDDEEPLSRGDRPLWIHDALAAGGDQKREAGDEPAGRAKARSATRRARRATGERPWGRERPPCDARTAYQRRTLQAQPFHYAHALRHHNRARPLREAVLAGRKREARAGRRTRSIPGRSAQQRRPSPFATYDLREMCLRQPSH